MSYLGPEANFRLLFNELLENKVHYDSNGYTIEVSGKENSFKQILQAVWRMVLKTIREKWHFSGVI